jgi:hypothetical protein
MARDQPHLLFGGSQRPQLDQHVALNGRHLVLCPTFRGMLACFFSRRAGWDGYSVTSLDVRYLAITRMTQTSDVWAAGKLLRHQETETLTKGKVARTVRDSA